MSSEIDTSWIDTPRHSETYINGVAKFMQFAKKGAKNGKIRCPCNYCQVDRRKLLPLDEVESHILYKGFYKEYRDWIFHGPLTLIQNISNQRARTSDMPIHDQVRSIGENNLAGLLRDVIGINHPFCADESTTSNIDELNTNDIIDDSDLETNDFCPKEEAKYMRILDTSNEELYQGCTSFSKLSFLLHLFNIKCLSNWSDKSFSMLLELLLDAFPQITNFPSSYYQAHKLIMDLGLGYENIDACRNDCTLYWDDMANEHSCPTCHTSRWKGDPKDKIPAKVMRYFPLIPRLKRMYMSCKTAEFMRWHDKDRHKDGLLRHPADALAWKKFDTQYPDFACDSRSVRLGLASDGFNPYRLMNTTYSTWPVVLIPYNLPPWLCMKQSSFILTMIIPRKTGPGNNIDVYLKPLLHELRLLWDGVNAFDAYSNSKFKMRAALMWTINDFPAYGMLCGCSTKGYYACPKCAHLTESIRIGNKICYIGHRRWLPEDHPFRSQGHLFDGTNEYGHAPTPASGSDILREQVGIKYTYGKIQKQPKKRKKQHEEENDVNKGGVIYNRRSIFFDLPYWEFNLLRHNLDVMHIEKNVCDNILGTLMNVDGKSKDDENARLFLEKRNIKSHLWLQPHEDGDSFMPLAPYCMSSEDKGLFLRVLANMKVPDGFGSNISRCVNLKQKKLINLKSHDNHILMQGVLPIALKASHASQVVVDLLDDLSSFFNSLCLKVIDPQSLDHLQSKISDILYRMEIEFLPPFFTIMVHLLIHLVEEVKLGGPVHYRWMYPIERYLAHLKSYVRNKAQPEGSIAEGYILEETITFCSRYLEGVETSFNRPRRNDDDNLLKERYLLNSGGRAIGQENIVRIEDRTMLQIHRYVLNQFERLIKPFIDEFVRQKQMEVPRGRIDDSMVYKWKTEEFPSWFKSQVYDIDEGIVDGALIKALARGPTPYAKRVKGYVINGNKFNTIARDRKRKTQSNGITVHSDGDDYFGKLTDILELDYHGAYSVVVFRCDWVDLHRGIRRDNTNRILVNFSKLIHTGRALSDEPFVIASQARQVFYVADELEKGWHYVIETKPRDVFDLGDDLGDY